MTINKVHQEIIHPVYLSYTQMSLPLLINDHQQIKELYMNTDLVFIRSFVLIFKVLSLLCQLSFVRYVLRRSTANEQMLLFIFQSYVRNQGTSSAWHNTHACFVCGLMLLTSVVKQLHKVPNCEPTTNLQRFLLSMANQ